MKRAHLEISKNNQVSNKADQSRKSMLFYFYFTKLALFYTLVYCDDNVVGRLYGY